MTDLQTLETTLLAEIGAATDEAALEAVRVSALGKKGSVSERLKMLGGMSPEERQQMGPAINGLKQRVTDALSDRRAESVALALAEYFDVPPENLVTQGYGESDLKVPTQEANRENRRVVVRNITPLLR